MLNQANSDPDWRRILGIHDPDVHLKDLEILLRGFAILLRGSSYKPSMTRFLNQFSRDSKKFTVEEISYFRNVFSAFLMASRDLQPEDFYSKTNKRFNLSIFEAVFSAACAEALASKNTNVQPISRENLNKLRNDPEFINAIQYKTAATANVRTRLERARIILSE
jgi:hypothetical protein